MALQEKAINWLENRTHDEIQEILQEIAEIKGVVSVAEYSEIMQIPERTVYEGIKTGRIKSFEFCGKKYPYIN